MKKIALLLFPASARIVRTGETGQACRAGIYYECDVFQYKV